MARAHFGRGRAAARGSRGAIVAAASAGLLILVGRDLAGRDSARADGGCPDAGTEAVAVASIEPRLVLRLRDGRLIRLAGLDPASATPDAPDREDTARAALATLVGDGAIAIAPLAAMPDRWGRIVAVAFRAGSDGATPRDIAAAAIGAGLGRYIAEPAAHGCRATLLAAEDKARAQRLGLWADPYYAVLAIDDRAGFAERAGTLVVAEGRLAAVETGPMRDTLIFAGPPGQPDDSARGSGNGSRRSQLLSATIALPVKKILEARGVHVSSLIGATLRLRGLLDLRFGPRLDLTGPDDFDVVAPAAALAGAK